MPKDQWLYGRRTYAASAYSELVLIFMYNIYKTYETRP